jgi:hypothetical protein
MMILHNFKVAKIISGHRQLHEDKQNGIIRIPVAVVPKTGKKKKGKKLKKAAPVDVTIKFKNEDGTVEEIVVKNSVKKKKKPKKKSKTATGDEDPSELEDRKESTDEETSDNMNELSDKLSEDQQNSLEDKYMQVLESDYQKERIGKDFKKVKIKASIRLIQKTWRNHYKRNKLMKIIRIQNWYRNIVQIKKNKDKVRELLKKKYYGFKIFNRLRFLLKVKRSHKMLSDENKVMLINTFSTKLVQVFKMQGFVRSIIAKTKLRILRSLKTTNNKQYKNKILEHKKLFAATKPTDSELIRRIGYSKIEIAAMDKYLSIEWDDFDKNWEEYEKKLEKYLKHEKQYEDWHETKDELGTQYWINNKTLKKSKKHPGIKSFKVNKQKLRNDAEDEQKTE